MDARDRLIQAAQELGEGRERAPTVAQVARRAGLSRATAYRYFSSRDRLLQAAGLELEGPERRRSEILEAAWHLFGRRGFQATTMDGVAEAAGVAKGTLYGHFASKTDLFRGLVSHLDVLPTLQRIARRAGPGKGPEDLREFVRLVLQLGRERGEILRTAVCELQRFPELRRLMLKTALRPGSRAIEEVLAAGQQAGRVRPLPVRQAAAAWISLLMGFNLLRVTFGEELGWDEEGLEETFFEILTRGMAASGAASDDPEPSR